MSITLPPHCKLSAVCSTDKLRPSLNHAYLVRRDDAMWLSATDSYRAVTLQVESEDAEEGWVPLPVLKVLEAEAKAKNPTGIILEQVSDRAWSVETERGAAIYKVGPARFPDVAKLGFFDDRKGGCSDPFGFNAALLDGVAKAMGAPRGNHPVRLVVDSPLQAIQVIVPGYEKSRRGLLMPIRLAL